MKNLKRTLSLVLAVALCFSLLTMGASAKTYKDDSSITYKEAVQWLTSLGVMNGELNSDGTYSLRPTDPITRAEYAKLICFVLNGGSDPAFGSTANTSFKDTTGHWAAGYIEALVASGYTAGYGDGTFGPEDTITGQQAAKIMLTVMGYNAGYEGLVGPTWAAKADALAGQKGLYKSLVSFKSTNLLTREQAAQIIWNALQKKTLSYAEAGTLGNKIVEGNKTLLTFYFDGIETAEGVLLANSVGSVDGSTPQAGKIKVQLWNDTKSTIILNSDPTTVAMLGQSVRFAYKQKSFTGSIEFVLLGDLASTEYNKTYTTTAGGNIKQSTVGFDIVLPTKDDKGNYTIDTKVVINNEVKSGDDTAKLLTNANSSEDYYVNGWGFPTTFIDNNGDGICEYIVTYATKPYEVDSVSSTTVTLSDLTGAEPTVPSITLANVINFSDSSKATLEEDQIVLGYIANSKFYVFESSSFSGKVTGKAQSTSGSNKYYKLTIDGTTYTLKDAATYADGCLAAAEDIVSPDKFSVNTSAKFYKDTNGYIFYVDDTKGGEGSIDFALIKEFEDSISLSNKGQYVELLYQDGTKGSALIKQVYNPDESKKTLEDISSDNRIKSDSSKIIAYTKNGDGSLNIYKTGIKAFTTPDSSVNIYKLDNDTPRIIEGTGYYKNKETDPKEYFTSSATKFVNTASEKAYVGYANVPDTTFAKGANLYIITQDVATDARAALLGGASSGSKSYVTAMFFDGAKLSSDKDAVWFYVQNPATYSQNYNSDNKLVKSYRAIVNGVVDTEFKVDNNKTLEKNTLYRVDEYYSDGKSVKTVDSTSYKLDSEALKVDLVDDGVVTVGGTTYTLTADTKYIDMTTTPNHTVVNSNKLKEGQTVFVRADGTTLEAYEIYIAAKP